ncbi:MAG: GntR family transcriptional regulator, rspAB operon transcriptional repressor [Gaiellales bacterium]|jgi:DNA-binding GntR family transcriptional regulator|nr:GntR family transcriptional regulator, rspAB operon transcriptional repressor [Gaiellales bacterium]MDX6599623.1 GntR family transcriptional regulator, rspAB operon transcriptional repressor [Gaiellales bacterium]
MASPPSERSDIRPIGGSKTYKYAVHRTLFEMIQNLDIAPGERLVEQDLSERFQVSKTPIREALLLLEKDRLIEIVPHTGATVSWLSLADYEQHLFILDALETPAMRLVSERASMSEFMSWQSEVDEVLQALSDNDLRRYRVAAGSLHNKIFSAAGFPRLTEMITAAVQALYRYGVLFIDSSPEERDRECEIVVRRVELLRRGEVDAAIELVTARHAAMLESAFVRVARCDPHVMRHLLEGQ